MQLIRLQVQGFRCLRNVDITFEPFTIIIGENDSGKSSIHDLLDIVLNSRRVDENDFCVDSERTSAERIEATLTFRVSQEDDIDSQYVNEQLLRIKRLYTPERNQNLVLAHVPRDERLRQNFDKLKAEGQKELICSLDSNVLEGLSNASQRVEWLRNFASHAEQTEDWVGLAGGALAEKLPRFERYSAMDYSDPSGMLLKTLRQVFEQVIYEEDGQGGQQLIGTLCEIKAQVYERIQDKLTDLREMVGRYNNRIREVRYEPVIDFSGGLRSGEIQIDEGRGLRYLTKTGAGTRRRMFMAALDWDREIVLQQAERGVYQRPVIRGYDEPDTNLHYSAQRRMYRAISDIVHPENSRTQAILCTHSLTMIDQAPARDIRCLALDEGGYTVVDQLCADEDPEVEEFLKNLARELGITNSLLFYDRCFILTEGITEEIALPWFYRKIYGHSMLEDGIRVVNVNGSGGGDETLRLFRNNRREYVLILADSDVETNKGAKLKRSTLSNLGYELDIIFHIGSNEFEDAFPDEVIVDCLTKDYPKASGGWTTFDIAQIRNADKFSDALMRLINTQKQQDNQWVKKPVFANTLGRHCPVEHIPQVIQDLFARARNVAGIENRDS